MCQFTDLRADRTLTKEADYKAFNALYDYVGTAILIHPKVIQSMDLTSRHSSDATEWHQGNLIQQKNIFGEVLKVN